MIRMKGKNDFAGCFDFFKWSAPIYADPRETMAAFEALRLRDKVIKRISVIGFAESFEYKLITRRDHRLQQLGLDAQKAGEDGCGQLDQILLPCEMELYEPVQLEFTDGTTLEMLPMDRGSMRFAVNSIPTGLTTGMNRSGLDAQALFGEALTGRRFEKLSVWVEKNSTTCYDADILRYSEPHETVRTKYRYQLGLDEGISISLTSGYHNSKFSLELRKNGGELEIPYSRITGALRKINQIVLAPGRASGSSMWFVPAKDGEEQGADLLRGRYPNWTFSMDDDLCCEFLGTLLRRYFDSSIQERGEYDYRGFDQYGVNRYTYDSVKKLLAEARLIARLLGENYDAPELEEIKRRFCPNSFGDRDWRKSRTPEETEAFIRSRIHIAIEFYERFADHLERIMEASGDCDRILVCGP